MLVVAGIAGGSFAASPGSQPSSSASTVPLVFPDVRMIQVVTEDLTYSSTTPPSSGDQVPIKCGFEVCGCTQTSMLWVRVDIDNALFYEKEVPYVPLSNNPPHCTLGTAARCSSSIKYVGTWTATAGIHTIKCILDSKNVIGEGPRNEFNNTKSITINVPWPRIDKMKDIQTKPPIPVPVPRAR